MKTSVSLAVTIVLLNACSGGRSEPLPIQTAATLKYEVVFFGLSSDTVTVCHDFTRQADGSFEIKQRVEEGKDDGETRKPLHCDANGIDADGNPHCFFLAAKAPIHMPAAARHVDARFHGFRVKEELEWNGYSAVRVVGRDNWKWYYSRDTGLFLGGQFVIGAGGFKVKLISAEGFGSP